ncbi:MAG: hypothetical protein VXZ72_03235 [Chlamydiota bacterium]|nr:hypothetical protein [Chlamydiota bacterium]
MEQGEALYMEIGAATSSVVGACCALYAFGSHSGMQAIFDRYLWQSHLQSYSVWDIKTLTSPLIHRNINKFGFNHWHILPNMVCLFIFSSGLEPKRRNSLEHLLSIIGISLFSVAGTTGWVKHYGCGFSNVVTGLAMETLCDRKAGWGKVGWRRWVASLWILGMSGYALAEFPKRGSCPMKYDSMHLGHGLGAVAGLVSLFIFKTQNNEPAHA